MTTHAIAEKHTVLRSPALWTAGVLIVLTVVALRFFGLSRPADYDEGVYWQSLRLMSAGYVLYRDIYDSQPPLFLLLAYPFYAAFGSTIAAARLLSLFASLLGLYAMYSLGKQLAGRAGGLCALALLALNVPYLSQSQSFHAEMPATSLAIAGVALSLRRGQYNAALAGICIGAALLCKFLVVAAPVPFIVLALMHRRTRTEVGAFACGFFLVFGVTAAAFRGDLQQVFAQAFALHTAAAHAYRLGPLANLEQIGYALRTPLFLAALLGAYLAWKRRKADAVSLIAWFIATAVSLLMLNPLWDHHLLVLFPPLIALATLGLAPLAHERIVLQRVVIALLILEGFTDGYRLSKYYRESAMTAAATNAQYLRAAADLSSRVAPNDFVITDLQNVAAQAGRNTPPWLVDTSEVRVRAGKITSAMLISQAKYWNVHAVLEGSARLTRPELVQFQNWMHTRYRLAATYGKGVELWLR